MICSKHARYMHTIPPVYKDHPKSETHGAVDRSYHSTRHLQHSSDCQAKPTLKAIWILSANLLLVTTLHTGRNRCYRAGQTVLFNVDLNQFKSKFKTSISINSFHPVQFWMMVGRLVYCRMFTEQKPHSTLFTNGKWGFLQWMTLVHSLFVTCKQTVVS